MLKRLRDGMFNPSNIVEYKNDKWWITGLFFIMLALVSALPSLFVAIKGYNISYDEFVSLRNDFRLEEIPFEIKNGELLNKNNDNDFVYQKNVNKEYIVVVSVENADDVKITEMITVIYLEKDGVYLRQYFTEKHKLFSYNEYPDLMNLDLEKVIIGDYDLWTSIINVVNQELASTKDLLYYLNIVYTLGVFVFELLIFSLIVALLHKLNLSNVKFVQVWKLIIYILSPYVFGQFISSIYGIDLFLYIGILVSVIYASKVGRQLSNSRGI